MIDVAAHGAKQPAIILDIEGLDFLEKKLAKDPSRFGKGAIEGVAAPEASNNAAAAGAMVPMLSLGVPGSGTTAIILGALIMFGIRPGPELFAKNADLVWAVIASMYIGNVILLILNLPLAGLFARLLKVPYRWLYPPILALCIAGVYSQANSVEDCWLLAVFGALGWLMKRYDWPAAPMVPASPASLANPIRTWSRSGGNMRGRASSMTRSRNRSPKGWPTPPKVIAPPSTTQSGSIVCVRVTIPKAR